MSLILKCLLPLLALVPVAGWAQASLRDPTMPPGAVQGAEGGGAVMAQPLIRITPLTGGRKQADVDGRTVQTGQAVRNWRVVNITATSVVLKDARGTRTVATPTETVRKRPVSASASEQ
jgi:hypothetical protein